MRRLLFACLLFLAGCGALRNHQLRPFYNEMDSSIGRMTYDDALQRWGQPAQATEGDAIVICSWGGSSQSTFYLPVGKSYVAEPVNNGWRLDLTFDKESRLMKTWAYREW